MVDIQGLKKTNGSLLFLPIYPPILDYTLLGNVRRNSSHIGMIVDFFVDFFLQYHNSYLCIVNPKVAAVRI